MNLIAILSETLDAADEVLTASGAVRVPNSKAGARLGEAYDRLDVALKAIGKRPMDATDPVVHARAVALRGRVS